MKPMIRGLAVAALQCMLVLTVAGKYSYDRDHLPRAWASAAPVDPNLPIRGRYVSLRLRVDVPGNTQGTFQAVRLESRDGRLTAVIDPHGTQRIWRVQNQPWTVWDPVAFFLPEHVPDPSRVAKGEELWVEVSVPRTGPPRPIRLAIK